MKKIKLFVFIISMLLIACKKEQAELAEFNKNCSTSGPISAAFTMTEVGAGVGSLDLGWNSETDSMWGGSTVWFYALEDSADYTWYIGADIIHERGFYKVIPETYNGYTLPMTLVVKKKPNNICNPFDDGYDSIVKPLSIVYEPNYYHEPIHYEGNYRLKEEAAIDSVDININLRSYDENTGGIPQYQWYSFVITGWDLCEEVHGRVIGKTTYRKLWLSNNWYGAKEKCPVVKNFKYHKQLNGIVSISGFRADGTTFSYNGRKIN